MSEIPKSIGNGVCTKHFQTPGERARWHGGTRLRRALHCGSNVKSKAAVAIRGALGTARPTSALDYFKGVELSNTKVGRGVPTAPGLEREFSNRRNGSRVQGAIVSGNSAKTGARVIWFLGRSVPNPALQIPLWVHADKAVRAPLAFGM